MLSLSFLLYDSRSGSTLFASLLNRYRDVAVSHESAFVSNILEYHMPLDTQKDLARLVEFLARETQFRELELDADALLSRLAGLPEPFARKDIIREIIGFYFQGKDPHATHLVIKHPPYYYIRTLLTMFPETRFIQLVRDGRAVFNSKRQSRSLNGFSMGSNLFHEAFNWRKCLRLSTAAGGNLLEIRYEDLMQSPEGVLERVLDFLDVPREGRIMTKSQADYYVRIGQAQKHLHKNVSRGVDGSIAHKWKRQLEPVDIYLYERLAGPMLRKYGYELTSAAMKQDLRFKVRVAGRFLYYTVHYLTVKVRNTLYWAFAERSLFRRVYVKYVRHRARKQALMFKTKLV